MPANIPPQLFWGSKKPLPEIGSPVLPKLLRNQQASLKAQSMAFSQALCPSGLFSFFYEKTDPNFCSVAGLLVPLLGKPGEPDAKINPQGSGNFYVRNLRSPDGRNQPLALCC